MSALAALSYFLDTYSDLGSTGKVLFMRAQATPSVQRFQERLTCEQTWKPRADGLEASGLRVTKEPTGTYELVLLLPERQRETILADLGRAYERLAEGGTLVVALHNEWGAKRTEQQLMEVAGEVQTLSKHHSRVFWAMKTGDWDTATLETWREGAKLRRILDGRFWSCPGLFNWDRIDEGSRLLTEHLPVTLSGAAADLGCGWGYLSDHLLRQCPNLRTLDLYEADAVALEAARRNVGLVPSPVKTRLHWHDVTGGVGEAKFDVVVMNPPFHDGRDAEPMLGLKFITAAVQALRPSGDLWLVANKHLPYEKFLTEAFEYSRTVVEARGFKILHANRPKYIPQPRQRRGKRDGKRGR